MLLKCCCKELGFPFRECKHLMSPCSFLTILLLYILIPLIHCASHFIILYLAETLNWSSGLKSHCHSCSFVVTHKERFSAIKTISHLSHGFSALQIIPFTARSPWELQEGKRKSFIAENLPLTVKCSGSSSFQ